MPEYYFKLCVRTKAVYMSSVSVVVQEAISTGDPEIVQLCLQSRDHQRHSQRTGDVPSLLKKLREVRPR